MEFLNSPTVKIGGLIVIVVLMDVFKVQDDMLRMALLGALSGLGVHAAINSGKDGS